MNVSDGFHTVGWWHDDNVIVAGSFMWVVTMLVVGNDGGDGDTE